MDDTPNTDDLRELLTEAERMALDAEEGAEINGSASLEPDDEDDKEVELGWREAATGAEAEADEEATAGKRPTPAPPRSPSSPSSPPPKRSMPPRSNSRWRPRRPNGRISSINTRMAT